jgi:hypothetical protein
MHETASEFIETNPNIINQSAKWSPNVGQETNELLSTLGLQDNSRDSVLNEALRILSKCIPPTDASGVETGLVIGYVQSGKTMSFTTVTALARDNQYPVIIVITGISNPLQDQSSGRLIKDLQLSTRRDRKWQHFSNPSTRNNNIHTMQNILSDWRDASVPENEQQTILITVMKNHRHLNNLNTVLSSLDLRTIPVLVVDDEADQAGLNTKVQEGEQSTTYQRLLELRSYLPHHTYLQYTATPQAPLLITLIDTLSPNWVELLTPGPDYTGGRHFFYERRELIRIIHQNEIGTRNNPLHDPPASLFYTMKLFFLGVSSGIITNDLQKNRSMLVHPSQETLKHGQYFRWVRQAKGLWSNILSKVDDDQDKLDLIAEFRIAYNDLQNADNTIPPFDEILTRLSRDIRRTRVEEVNASRGATPRIDWGAAYAWILIGGQAMDRGFTVEGLTVTYMPRGIGAGNADTIQQRARFFGYKRSFIGYCRVYLSQDAFVAYRSYVDHEEDIRHQLISFRNRPLQEWKRAFLLNVNLKATRQNVLSLDYMRGNYSNSWYAPSAPHESSEAVTNNSTLIEQFISRINLRTNEGHPNRTSIQIHGLDPNISLEFAYEQLLTQYRLTRTSDSQKYTGLLLQISKFLEIHPEEICHVYYMSQGSTRERSVNEQNEIKNLFQGAYPVEKARRGEIYPGDREIRIPEILTIQIHKVKIKDNNVNDWAVQNQGGVL